MGNCDTSIFLGGKEPTTLKELNQSLGKETIDTYNTGESRGREVSHSLNYQKLGKDLATVDELSVLDGGKCILQLRGVRPFNRINTTSLIIRSTSICPTQTRKTHLILRSISNAD